MRFSVHSFALSIHHAQSIVLEVYRDELPLIPRLLVGIRLTKYASLYSRPIPIRLVSDAPSIAIGEEKSTSGSNSEKKKRAKPKVSMNGME